MICVEASLSAFVSYWSIAGRLLHGRYTPVIIPFPSSVKLMVPIRDRNDEMQGPRMESESACP